MTVTLEDVKSKLFSFEQLETALSATEPLNEIEFTADSTSPVSFSLPESWNSGLKDLDGSQITPAQIHVGGNSFHLTKDAALQATSLIGLTKDFVSKTPANLIEPTLNWWFKNKGQTYKVLHRKDDALAIAKGNVSPFSNLELLNIAAESLEDTYGVSREDLWVDYKVHHSLRQTFFRVIVPQEIRVIDSKRSENDVYSVGIEVQNSLTGEIPLQLHGYLFAWICTNGMTSTHASSGSYSRRTSAAADDAYEWAKESVDSILEGLDHELDAVEQLTQISLSGSVNSTMRDIFEKYRVPIKPREGILAALVDSEDLSAYGVLQAISQAANSIGELSPTEMSRVLRISGDLTAELGEICSSCSRLPN